MPGKSAAIELGGYPLAFGRVYLAELEWDAGANDSVPAARFRYATRRASIPAEGSI
jgi:hypothetical protein